MAGEGKAWLLPLTLTRLALGELHSPIFFFFRLFLPLRSWSQAIAKPEEPLLGVITQSLFWIVPGDIKKVIARNWSRESDPEVEASLTECFIMKLPLRNVLFHLRPSYNVQGSFIQYTYLSLDAFNSRTASLKDVPSRALARHKILVVFPVPGGPWKIKFINFLDIKKLF